MITHFACAIASASQSLPKGSSAQTSGLVSPSPAAARALAEYEPDPEKLARRAMAKRLGLQIRETGFLAHTELRAGSSLDGDIDDFRAVVEIKCPKTTTHLNYIEGKALPEDYHGQVLHNLFVSQAEVLYFGSFDDRLPPHLQLFMVEVKAQDMPLEEYERDLRTFLQQLEGRIQALATPQPA